MNTDTSPLDVPTLRHLLDKWSVDIKIYADSIAERHALIKKLELEIEQYRGAAAYNAKIIQELQSQLPATITS